MKFNIYLVVRDEDVDIFGGVEVVLCCLLYIILEMECYFKEIQRKSYFKNEIVGLIKNIQMIKIWFS